MELLWIILVAVVLVGAAWYLEHHGRPKSKAPPEDESKRPKYTDWPGGPPAAA